MITSFFVIILSPPPLPPADINFGFVTASAEVGESIGTVDVCVQIFNPAAGEVFNSTLTVQLQVSPVTAGKGERVGFLAFN